MGDAPVMMFLGIEMWEEDMLWLVIMMVVVPAVDV